MAGNWLFSDRRWLDPRVSSEREILEANYDALCTAFPSFRACSKARFIENVGEVCAPWSELIEEARRQCKYSHEARERTAACDRIILPPLPPSVCDMHSLRDRSAGPANVGGNPGEDMDLYLLGLWGGDALGPMAWEAEEGPEGLLLCASPEDAA